MMRPPQPGMPPFMDRGLPPTSLPGDKGQPGMAVPGAIVSVGGVYYRRDWSQFSRHGGIQNVSTVN